MTDTSVGRARVTPALLATIGCAAMLVPLNSTMIAVALPRILDELGAGVDAGGWLITAYLITMASLQPVGGKLGDRLGRRTMLLGGYAAFGLASLGAALATDVAVLIVFRCAQAVSGALAFPNGTALLRELLPERRRGRAFGAAAGPPLGGLLVALGDWPAIFWVNLPLVVIVVAVGWSTIPRLEPFGSDVRFDVVGAMTLSAVLAVGAWVLIVGRWTVPLSIVAVVGAIGFVVLEVRHDDPVVEPRLFLRPRFAASTGAVALSNLSMYSVLLAVPFLLTERGGWSESRIGFVLTSMSAGMVLLAPLGGRLADTVGRRFPAAVGLGLLSVGVVGLALRGPEVATAWLVACLALSGVGLGLSAPAIQTTAVDAVEERHAGMGAASYSTSRYLGSIVGAGMLAGLLDAGDFSTLFTVAAVTAVASALLTLVFPGRRA